MLKKALRYCPACRAEALDFENDKKYSCRECGWVFYQNNAAAVAGILIYDKQLVSLVRAREPKAGLLDLPGGFVDILEGAEDALIRETKEEIGIEVHELNYLCSFPNKYHYMGNEYSTCDMFYVVELQNKNFTLEVEEVSGIELLPLDNLDLNRFAFDSIKKGLEYYLKLR